MVCRFIDFQKMGVESFGQQKAGEQYRSVFLQITLAHSAVFADGLIFVACSVPSQEYHNHRSGYMSILSCAIAHSDYMDVDGLEKAAALCGSCFGRLLTGINTPF